MLPLASEHAQEEEVHLRLMTAMLGEIRRVIQQRNWGTTAPSSIEIPILRVPCYRLAPVDCFLSSSVTGPCWLPVLCYCTIFDPTDFCHLRHRLITQFVFCNFLAWMYAVRAPATQATVGPEDSAPPPTLAPPQYGAYFCTMLEPLKRYGINPKPAAVTASLLNSNLYPPAISQLSPTFWQTLPYVGHNSALICTYFSVSLPLNMAAF